MCLKTGHKFQTNTEIRTVWKLHTVECQKPSIRKLENAKIRTDVSWDFRQNQDHFGIKIFNWKFEYLDSKFCQNPNARQLVFQTFLNTYMKSK